MLMMRRVQEVTEDKVTLSIKNPKDKDAKPEIKELDAGFVLWSTGIGEWSVSTLELGRWMSRGSPIPSTSDVVGASLQ
jgi:hypothetical protein